MTGLLTGGYRRRTGLAIPLVFALLTGLGSSAQAACFDTGLAVFGTKHYAEAFEIFKGCADRGDSMSQTMLGDMYERGIGVDQNSRAAAEWLRKAAEQNNPIAMQYLGTLTAGGRGEDVKQDVMQAAVWFGLAVHYGSEPAKQHLVIVTALMSDDELSEIKRRIEDWKKSH